MVLMTKLPLVALFTEVLAKIAPLFFSSGEPSIESGNIFISTFALK